MQSRNPVFARNDGFNGRSASAYPGQTDPSTWQTGSPTGAPAGYGSTPTATDQGRMTVDSVVQKTAISLLLVFAAAVATWAFIGPIDANNPDNLAKAYGLALGGALLGLVLSLVNSFKKVISPPLVLAFAVVEGVFVGAFSKVITIYVGGDVSIVYQAILGTVGAFAGTLAVYKFFNIKVTDKFRRGVTAAVFGFVGLALLNFALSFFGLDFGFRNMGMMGLIVGIAAVVLGVLMLILDFDYVERGVAAGLPERESWRAAFGLTVTLVWLYIEILRILAILRGSD